MQLITVQCSVQCFAKHHYVLHLGGLHMGELSPKLQSPEIMIIITFIIIAVRDDNRVRVFLVVIMGAVDM